MNSLRRCIFTVSNTDETRSQLGGDDLSAMELIEFIPFLPGHDSNADTHWSKTAKDKNTWGLSDTLRDTAGKSEVDHYMIHIHIYLHW